jgi:type I restriction enzyme S subunit
MMAIARVSELAEQIRGVSYDKEDAAPAPRPGYLPVLRAGNITDDGLVFDDLVFVPEQRIAEKQKIRRNDVVIAASSGSLDVVGKAARALSDYKGSFGAFCKVLRPHAHVDPAYFAHFFRTREYRRRVSTLAAGVNINNLRNKHLDEMLIPLPPLPEQRRIADILEKADALRAKRRAALAQVDTLVQSIFLDMFGEPTTNPKRWPLARLGQIAETTSGGTPRRDVGAFFGGGVPWVKSGELHSDLVTTTEETLTDRGLAESSAKLMRPGTVLVAMYGATVGAVSVLGIMAATNQAVCSITPTEALTADYLVAFLRRSTPSLLAKRVGGAQPNLSQDLLRKLVVPVPPPKLQDAFTNRLASVASMRRPAALSANSIDALFASLQDRAFRGAL